MANGWTKYLAEDDLGRQRRPDDKGARLGPLPSRTVAGPGQGQHRGGNHQGAERIPQPPVGPQLEETAPWLDACRAERRHAYDATNRRAEETGKDDECHGV